MRRYGEKKERGREGKREQERKKKRGRKSEIEGVQTQLHIHMEE
jgi:hypothetical protein